MSTKEVVMTEEWNESDDFKRVGTEGLSGEDIGEKSLTYWADVWRRFRENKLIECQNSRKSSPYEREVSCCYSIHILFEKRRSPLLLSQGCAEGMVSPFAILMI